MILSQILLLLQLISHLPICCGGFLRMAAFDVACSLLEECDAIEILLVGYVCLGLLAEKGLIIICLIEISGLAAAANC